MIVKCALRNCLHNNLIGECQLEGINLCNDKKGFYCYEYEQKKAKTINS